MLPGNSEFATTTLLPWYGRGLSDHRVGGLNFEVRFDYSYDGFMRSYEQALQRMGIDTVDALLVHDLDESIHLDRYKDHLAALVKSGMRAPEELKASGDIKAIGMGINTGPAPDRIAPSVELDFVLVAMPYTLLDQAAGPDRPQGEAARSCRLHQAE